MQNVNENTKGGAANQFEFFLSLIGMRAGMAAGRTTLWGVSTDWSTTTNTPPSGLSVLITSLGMDRFSGASSGAPPLSPSLSLRFNSGTMGSIVGLGKKSAFPLLAFVDDVIIVCENMFTFGGALCTVIGSRIILGGLTDGESADLAGARGGGAGSERFLL